MTPPFDIEGGVIGGLALAAARAFGMGGMMAAFGGVLYPVLLAPRGIRPCTAARLRGSGYGGLALAVAGLLTWLLAETNDLAGDMHPGSISAVLFDTLFGHLLMAQGVLVALALVTWRLMPAAAPVPAGAAILLQAGHSHAWSMDGFSILLAADALHVMAAAAWLGCLVPLLVVVGGEPPETAASAGRRFSSLGLACVCAILLTAAYQGYILLGGAAAIIGTAYGWMALLKAALFACLLILALRNRARYVPALSGNAPAAARRRLARRFGRSIGMEVALGLAVVAAAGVLTELPPAMHEQPVWPFPWRLSLDAVREDPDFLHEAVQGAVMMAAAILLLAAAAVSLLRWRKAWQAWLLRGGAAAASVTLALFASPHLDLLFVPASPTQYYHSPTGFSVASVSDGAALFPHNCAACHGADGRGDGPAAKGLPVPPANLTAAHLWMHSDGELFWWLAHGIPSPDGTPAMPGFADTLTEDQRWDLIDYIRGHNAGTSVGPDGSWGRVVPAPGFGMRCVMGQGGGGQGGGADGDRASGGTAADSGASASEARDGEARGGEARDGGVRDGGAGGQTRQLSDFLGQPVRLVLGEAVTVPGVLTIAADGASALAAARNGSAKLPDGPTDAPPGSVHGPRPGLCIARDEQIGLAYAAVAGLAGDVTGAVFLIDADGLLRRVYKPARAPDAGTLMAALADIRAHRAEPALAASGVMSMGAMSMGGMTMGGAKMDGAKMDGMTMGGTGENAKMPGMKM